MAESLVFSKVVWLSQETKKEKKKEKEKTPLNVLVYFFYFPLLTNAHYSHTQ